MAELQQSDSIALEGNENPSPGASENVGQQPSHEPSEAEAFCSHSLITTDETLLLEHSVNNIKVSNEIISTGFDIPAECSDDEKNVSTTILDFLSTCKHINQVTTNDNYLESSEILNEININELNGICSPVSGSHAAYRSSDCAIHDSENNVAEITEFWNDLNVSNNDLELIIADSKIEENDMQLKDEFHDAAQFFKDPSTFTFLEKAGSSGTQPYPSLTRSSLLVNFDPLYAELFSQSTESNNLVKTTEDDTENFSSVLHNNPHDSSISDSSESASIPDVAKKTNVTPVPNIYLKNSEPNLVNKHLNNIIPRGNMLISFDSPVKSKDFLSQCLLTEMLSDPKKLYTEEELRQALKIKELSFQETIQRKELVLSDKNKVLQEKLEVIDKENYRLGEDLRSVENTFAELHKEFKNLSTLYSQNEGTLKKLQEKEIYHLESKIQHLLDKVNLKVIAAGKACDSQATALKTLLNKIELNISSSENVIQHVKIENGKLNGIGDDLMGKVSEA